MPLFDFYCDECRGWFEGLSEGSKALGHIKPVRHTCGLMCEQRWRKAPGIKSSETMPKDLARAAKFNFGIEFETRADHDKYCEEQGLTPEVTQFDDIAKAACVTPDESDEPKLTPEEAESSRKNSIDMWDRWEAENLDPLPTTTLTSDELATVSDQIESE